MSKYSKVGSVYISEKLPTKNGYERIVIKSAKRKLSWIAVNNHIKKEAP